MPLSYGYIETLGLISAVEAADAMLKAAKINLVDKREIGFGLVTVIIEGELGAVQSSVDAGCVAAERIGQLISSNVIPRPYNDTSFFNESPGKKDIKPGKTVQKIETPAPKKEKKLKPVKSQPKEKEKSSAGNVQQVILTALKKLKKEGASLKEISKLIKMDQAETRVVLKELLDKELIEKVQQNYYLI